MCCRRLGAAAASVLSQNLERQGFFQRGIKRQRMRKIMRDMIDRDREKERVRKIIYINTEQERYSERYTVESA
jgi:hypothetical protein